ncbi:poly-gamma-glutamate hydrolase family protein [Oceanobacillus locisalsi]|uniref:Poly-gamma-glutamate hydrolase family protein n=1 Tax=Oceanobacillus locisalsi TaxID=546107 RepID=A0ABW3NGX8_9BACI
MKRNNFIIVGLALVVVMIAMLLANGSNGNDTYKTFNELSQNERQEVDYKIRSEKGNSDVAIIAIHGGGIEPGTTDLAQQLALAGEYTFYSFQGIKSANNTVLHIDSTNFDEPEGLALVSDSFYTISFHGYEDELEKHTYLGGLDETLTKSIEKELKNAGFSVSDAPNEFNGEEKGNIVNQNKQNKGVQLEISTAQRKAFFEDGDFSSVNRDNRTEEFYDYVEAIGRALSGD